MTGPIDTPQADPAAPDLSRVWVVMPAFNEGKVIAATVRDVLARFPNLVIIDDCSRDHTGEIARAAGATVLRHSVNLGQGAALQTGIDFAREQGAEEVVTFDSDGQHRVEDALAMVIARRAEDLDVALGSRFLGDAVGMSAAKGRFLKAAVFYTRWTTGLALTDTHNGLRVLGPKALREIRIRQNRMAHASEILSLIAETKLRYREFPITITYSAYSMAKGQRMTGAVNILLDLFIRKLYR